jgi:hypothetical protein
VRGLFPDRLKNETYLKRFDAIWDRVGRGELSIDEARAQIHDLAGGIEPPAWLGQNARSLIERTTTYGRGGPPEGPAIAFEVAPDPRNRAVVARWNALPRMIQDEISHRVAWAISKRALEGVGEALWGVAGKQRRAIVLKGALHRETGAWMADPNPSLVLRFTPDSPTAKISVLTRLMGYALRQRKSCASPSGNRSQVVWRQGSHRCARLPRENRCGYPRGVSADPRAQRRQG